MCIYICKEALRRRGLDIYKCCYICRYIYFIGSVLAIGGYCCWSRTMLCIDSVAVGTATNIMQMCG